MIKIRKVTKQLITILHKKNEPLTCHDCDAHFKLGDKFVASMNGKGVSPGKYVKRRCMACAKKYNVI